MAILKRDQALKPDELPCEIVEVPEWGGEIMVRAMTAAQADRFGNEITKDDRLFRVKVVIETAIDENGEKFFRPEDIEALSGKLFGPINRISEVALRISGYGSRAVEAAVENFTETAGAGSHLD